MEVYGDEVELVRTIFKSKQGTEVERRADRARRKVGRGSDRDRTLLRPRRSHSTELDSGYGLISTQLANRRHAFDTTPLKGPYRGNPPRWFPYYLPAFAPVYFCGMSEMVA